MFDPQICILVVDDMRTMRKLVQRSLKELGFSNFVEAEDGDAAWQALSSDEHKINLIISDWNMPKCSGLELLKKVRASKTLKHLPFMLLTAETEASQVKEALLAGVDDYLIKPFNTEAIKLKLESVYKKKSAA